MMKTLLVITLVVLAAFPSGVGAIRKPDPTPTPNVGASRMPGASMVKGEMFYGVIKKVNEKGKTVTVEGRTDGGKKTSEFAVDKRTRITRGGAPLKLEDLKKGSAVSVMSTRDRDALIAVEIELSGP